MNDYVYKLLSNIIGEKWISRDPAILSAYSRVRTGLPLEKMPECVILPELTEQIQAIYRLANKHKFKIIPTGSFYFISCVPARNNYVTIDPKRMNKFYINEKN